MQIEYHTRNLSGKERETLLYLASSRYKRKKMDVERPSRETKMELWRKGILGAYWHRGRHAWYRKPFVPKPIREQLNNDGGMIPDKITVDINPDHYAVLQTAAKLWEEGKTGVFERKFTRVKGGQHYGYHFEPEWEERQYKIRAVIDTAMMDETGLSREGVRGAIRWLDGRGFLIGVVDSLDADSAAYNAKLMLEGYKYHKSRSGENWNKPFTKSKGPYEVRFPADIPFEFIDGINKNFGARNEQWKDGEEPVLHLFLPYFLSSETDEPGYFDYLGDEVRESMRYELIRRAAKTVQKRAKKEPYEKRDLSHYGKCSVNQCMAYDLREEFGHEISMFNCRAAIAFRADEDDSIVPEDIVERITKDELDKQACHGARFTKERLKRAKELADGNAS